MQSGAGKLVMSSFAWFLISQVLLCPFAEAQELLWKLIGQSTAYIFYVRPTVYKDYLNFPGPIGSPIKSLPIVKVTISYCCVQAGTVGEEIPYESLWYRGLDPLGCRRYSDFHISPHDDSYVYLSSCADVEQGAVANALVRLYLDTILNCNHIMSIEVPNQYFWELIRQLERENFYVPSKLPGTPEILNTLTLIDTGGDKQVVTYYGT